MTDKLSGISNENEFYSNHYLATGIDADLKDLVADWKREAVDGARAPYEQLESLATGWVQEANDYRPIKDDGRRLIRSREFAHKLLGALGYDVGAQLLEDNEGKVVPLLARVTDASGSDVIWVVEALSASGEDFASDPLVSSFNCVQFPDASEVENRRKGEIDRAITRNIFSLEAPPRFILVWSLSSIVLIDRYRWAQRSVLRFDLQEIFTKRSADTLKIAAALLHRQSMCPTTGKPLVDQIAEESIRHANAVSTSLKATMRDAIEILGNEVLTLTGGRFKGKPIDEKELTIECLRHMYRLLFLLFVEARQDLGFAPMKSETYRKGYSLDALRELELVPLRTKEDREGTMLSDSLGRLLGMMFDGTPSLQAAQGSGISRRDFALQAVRVELLDPESTPIVSSLRLRNEAVQQIIRLMSLSTGKGSGRAGRISYSQLGISQLGAVYETLLSFTGFIAKEDLIEVKPGKAVPADASDADDQGEADDEDGGETVEESAPVGRADKIDLLGPAWFVPASRASEFRADEIVFDGVDARKYPKGRFIYRLAGRDRQNSASYYTPEPLARLLVRHALLELCEGLGADDILKLRICEPAMGSAAFLVETTNQLADLYLERKQAELGRVIPQDDYATERQKVRAYIADRNCFGVDLNPVAVELGQISMWLNCLHSGGFAPWFGDQLHAGNSLFGARRAAYSVRNLTRSRGAELWFRQTPEEIGWRGVRSPDQVWQFLLPAEGMVDFHGSKAIKSVAADEQKAISEWRKGGFFDPLDDVELKLVQGLSRVCDQLFEEVADAWQKERAATNDDIAIWPESARRGAQTIDYRQKRELLRVFQNESAGNSLPYKRLKTAMDTWCALWCWPLDKVDQLPWRAEFFVGLSLVLEGRMAPEGGVIAPARAALAPRQGEMFEPDPLGNGGAGDQSAAVREARLFHEVNIDELVESTPWLQTARDVARRTRFVHFDLVFADILRERGGFDLIIGNPPWRKPEWSDNLVLGDMDPTFAVRGYSSKQTEDLKPGYLAQSTERLDRYLAAFVDFSGPANATGSFQMMPFAGSGQNNLYRCFVDLAFRQLAPSGRAALIHQDSHLVDPKAGEFRAHWYGRITKHFEFGNRITSKLFAEVAHYSNFSLNIYRGTPSDVDFLSISSAFLPSQVEACFSHDGTGEIPALKAESGGWDTRPHAKRLVHIGAGELAAIRAISEDDTVPLLSTRFIQPYSQDTPKVFAAFAACPGFREGAGDLRMDPVWHESGAQSAGMIRRGTGFRDSLADEVLTGPMIHVGNPLYKSPKRNYRTKGDYEVVDLTHIPADYLPRTNFERAAAPDAYRAALPVCPWDPTKSHVDQFRIAFRRRINLNSERSLIGALIPPGPAHIHGVESLGMADDAKLVAALPQLVSVMLDFLVKVTGKGDIMEKDLLAMPWIDAGATAQHRGLRLSALTEAYAPLWNKHADGLNVLPWSSDDPRLTMEGSVDQRGPWTVQSALRTDFARRLALVEIDVLVAMALGLTVEQLSDIYRIHFPVLRQYDDATWFDQNGRIVWTASKGLPKVGYLDDREKSPSMSVWQSDFAGMETGSLTCSATIDFRPGGPEKVTREFVAPFTKCDRIADYERAWKHFESHGVTSRHSAA